MVVCPTETILSTVKKHGVPLDFTSKQCWVKRMMGQKNVGSKDMWVKKKFWDKKMLGQKS